MRILYIPSLSFLHHYHPSSSFHVVGNPLVIKLWSVDLFLLMPDPILISVSLHPALVLLLRLVGTIIFSSLFYFIGKTLKTLYVDQCYHPFIALLTIIVLMSRMNYTFPCGKAMVIVYCFIIDRHIIFISSSIIISLAINHGKASPFIDPLILFVKRHLAH